MNLVKSYDPQTDVVQRRQDHDGEAPQGVVQEHPESTTGFAPETIARFWSRINKDGSIPEHVPHLGKCWVWTAGVRGRGYGAFYADKDRRNIATHRLMWSLNQGAIPQGLYVMHKCDNPPCVNPAHLFLGTPLDNVSDMIAKGRRCSFRGDLNGSRRKPESRPRGADNGKAVLSEGDVRSIRLRLSQGERGTEIAKEYGVTKSCIYHVRKYKWRHIK